MNGCVPINELEEVLKGLRYGDPNEGERRPALSAGYLAALIDELIETHR